jgi:hypothetical protein
VIEIVKLLLMLLFAAISIAALLVFIMAVSTVGLGGFLPFTTVEKHIFAKAAPYRRRVLYLIIAAVIVCAVLAVLELFF